MPQVFDILIVRLKNCLKIIQNNLYIGVEGRVDATREFFIAKTNYFIVYRIVEKEKLIELLSILHTSRKYF